MSNLGLWDRWYGLLDPKTPEPFGRSDTYALGAEWLADCDLVEDWGCGKGWMRHHIPADRYRGLDGSHTPFADQIVDLAEYTSWVPGIYIRHVLEHDERWARIWANALASARHRLFLAVFTPPSDGPTHTIGFSPDPTVPVPDISFHLPDLTGPAEAAGFVCTAEVIASPTQYGVETMLRCAR